MGLEAAIGPQMAVLLIIVGCSLLTAIAAITLAIILIVELRKGPGNGIRRRSPPGSRMWNRRRPGDYHLTIVHDRDAIAREAEVKKKSADSMKRPTD
jgi:hypothetical protein